MVLKVMILGVLVLGVLVLLEVHMPGVLVLLELRIPGVFVLEMFVCQRCLWCWYYQVFANILAIMLNLESKAIWH